MELIKEKDVESVLKAIEELKAIKKELVTTDNIKNIIFGLPREDTYQGAISFDMFFSHLVILLPHALLFYPHGQSCHLQSLVPKTLEIFHLSLP